MFLFSFPAPFLLLLHYVVPRYYLFAHIFVIFCRGLSTARTVPVSVVRGVCGACCGSRLGPPLGTEVLYVGRPACLVFLLAFLCVWSFHCACMPTRTATPPSGVGVLCPSGLGCTCRSLALGRGSVWFAWMLTRVPLLMWRAPISLGPSARCWGRHSTMPLNRSCPCRAPDLSLQ